jgi:hypothetical protein
MSTSYTEISASQLVNQSYEKMDVGEDLIEEETDRKRPDSLCDTDGQCKLWVHVVKSAT